MKLKIKKEEKRCCRPFTLYSFCRAVLGIASVIDNSILHFSDLGVAAVAYNTVSINPADLCVAAVSEYAIGLRIAHLLKNQQEQYKDKFNAYF